MHLRTPPFTTFTAGAALLVAGLFVAWADAGSPYIRIMDKKTVKTIPITEAFLIRSPLGLQLMGLASPPRSAKRPSLPLIKRKNRCRRALANGQQLPTAVVSLRPDRAASALQ